MKGTFVSGGLVLLIACGAPGAARAACGIGSTIWEGNNSTAAKVLAFTTDVFTWKGISTTFEIAGCTEKDNIFKRVASAKVRHYASNNFDRLAEDISRGNGEHLDAFARLLQMDEQDGAAFKAFAQKNFELLFPHDHVTVADFLNELALLMAENATLSPYVRN